MHKCQILIWALFKGGAMKSDIKSCLCPYCGKTLSKENCVECSHKDFMFEDVCFCPHSEAYFLQEEPLAGHTFAKEEVIFPEWQGPKKKFFQ